MNTTITAIPGLLAGHATDHDHHTGCTVVLSPDGWTPGVALPGFAPGSRELELMRAESLVDSVHGVVLSGGSAFGLCTCDGVMRFLREKDIGFAMPHATIPIVPGAVIYDLDTNRMPGCKPDADMGYAAAVGASGIPLQQGSVGVGTGARCGRLFSMRPEGNFSAPSGVGTALTIRDGVMVGAVVVVNSMGNVHDPDTGAFIAGGRHEQGAPFSRDALWSILAGEPLPRQNTVLTVVAANVPLDKAATTRLARMAATGISQTVRPAHLVYDGDVVFALTPRQTMAHIGLWSESLLGVMAAEAVAKAIVNAVRCS